MKHMKYFLIVKKEECMINLGMMDLLVLVVVTQAGDIIHILVQVLVDLKILI